MAEIKYTYKDASHNINSYDDVLNSYTWIRNALGAVFQNRDDLRIHCSVIFSADELTYECDSINEFKKYAFGKNIAVDRMLVYVTDNWVSSLMNVFASNKKDAEMQEFVLTSKDEMLIINLRDALRTNKEPEPKQKETIVMKIEDNSVHFGDNNQITNSVIGSKNTAEIEQETVVPEKMEESNASKSFWQILVPIVVIVVGAAICFWLKIN